jgi:hypothetical protein
MRKVIKRLLCCNKIKKMTQEPRRNSKIPAAKDNKRKFAEAFARNLGDGGEMGSDDR